MSKVILDSEIAEIVGRIIYDKNEICEFNIYGRFLGDLARLICDYCGGDVLTVSPPDDDLGWRCHIVPNDSLPSDGGIFKHYDTDVDFINGKEV